MNKIIDIIYIDAKSQKKIFNKGIYGLHEHQK